MMRWVTKYIDENNEKWEIEKEKRDQNNQQRLKDWAKLSRLDKIKQIKEKQAIKSTKLIVTLKPTAITLPSHPHHPHNPEHNQVELQSNQAEQCHILQGGSRLDTTPAVPVKNSSMGTQAEPCTAQPESPHGEDQAEQQTQMQDQPIVDGGRAEQNLTAILDDQGDTMSSGRAEHHDSPSSSSSNTPNTRQSHTIKWAVARYVSTPVINSIDHVLIDKHVGTTPTEYQAKPQCSMDADVQAEQCPPQPETNSEEDQADQQYPP